MNELDRKTLTPAPTAARPLLGLTVLVVEDSRFACEAMRLLCLRSGARIRRADSLRAAHRHLKVYRPSVVIVDLGLPDGSGAELIHKLAHSQPRIEVILGTSGDDMNEAIALAAGADGFLTKPLSSLAAFQSEILKAMPEEMRPLGLRSVPEDKVKPDLMAFHDDMAHAAEILSEEADEKSLLYIAKFIQGVADCAEDAPLSKAARDLTVSRSKGQPLHPHTAKLAGLVQKRVASGGVI